MVLNNGELVSISLIFKAGSDLSSDVALLSLFLELKGAMFLIFIFGNWVANKTVENG